METAQYRMFFHENIRQNGTCETSELISLDTKLLLST